MTDQAISTMVHRLYRIRRQTLNPLAAMVETRAVFAECIARDTILRDRDANPYDRQAWLYADQLVDLIVARRGRDGMAGRYWQTGVQHPTRGTFLLYAADLRSEGLIGGCAKLACTIRHGMSYIQGLPGGRFTVKDRRGRVYVKDVTELSTMGELFDQAKAVRA